jgi:hypothetical protein
VLAALCRGRVGEPQHRDGQAAVLAGGLLRVCFKQMQLITAQVDALLQPSLPNIDAPPPPDAAAPPSQLPPPPSSSSSSAAPQLARQAALEEAWLLQRWLCLCVAECCDSFDDARVEALRDFVPGVLARRAAGATNGQSKGGGGAPAELPCSIVDWPSALRRLLRSPSTDVRAAAVHCMGRLFGGSGLCSAWQAANAAAAVRGCGGLTSPPARGSGIASTPPPGAAIKLPGGGAPPATGAAGTTSRGIGLDVRQDGVVVLAHRLSPPRAQPIDVARSAGLSRAQPSAASTSRAASQQQQQQASRGNAAAQAALAAAEAAAAAAAAAAVLPGTPLLRVGTQDVAGLGLAEVHALIAAQGDDTNPCELCFECGQEDAEWAAKEVALAYFLIHAMSDASPVVRLELCNGLSRFVEHHREAFVSAMPGATASAQAGISQDNAWAWTTFTAIWSCVQSLRADALPVVANRANMIHTYISIHGAGQKPAAQGSIDDSGTIYPMSPRSRGDAAATDEGDASAEAMAQQALRNRQARLATSSGLKNSLSKGDSGAAANSAAAKGTCSALLALIQFLRAGHQPGSPTNNRASKLVAAALAEDRGLLNLLQSHSCTLGEYGPQFASELSTEAMSALATDLERSDRFKMASEPSPNNATQQQQQQQPPRRRPSDLGQMRAAVATPGPSWLKKFGSSLYSEAAPRFAAPLLSENCCEPDPALEQRRRWRWRRARRTTLRAAGVISAVAAGGGSTAGRLRRSLEEEANAIASFDHQLPSLNSADDVGTGQGRGAALSLQSGSGGSRGTSHTIFHPTEPLLIAADDSGPQISVWNYKQGRKVVSLDNANPAPARITALGLANEHDRPLLIVGSDDGMVRLWESVHGLKAGELDLDSSQGAEVTEAPPPPYLCTGWQALSGLTPGARGPGLVVHWRQARSPCHL